MSRDYRGDLRSGMQGWLSTRQVRWCMKSKWHQGLFSIDISTSWSRYGSWGHWHWHCWGQPTQSGQHTTSAKYPTEYSTQCDWYSSRDSQARWTGDGLCSHTYSSWSVPSQFYSPGAAIPSESVQGTTETRSLNYFSVFLRDCRLLDTVSRLGLFPWDCILGSVTN